MPNTSATGGFLTPSTTPAPLEDDALLDFLHDWIVGIVGIDPTLVRPRWQPEAPNLPDYGTTWIAFGITEQHPDTFAALLHSATGNGFDELRRHEYLEVLVSVYGPQSATVAAQLSDGIQVPQNLEYLSQSNFGLTSSGRLRSVPELVKQRWLKRVDFTITLKRQIVRTYGVENLVSSQVSIDNEHYLTQVQVP